MRNRRQAGQLTAAAVCMTLVPVVLWGSTSYGVETLVWDAAHGSFTYVDQPGGGLVLIVGVLIAVGLIGRATWAIIAVARDSRRPVGPR